MDTGRKDSLTECKIYDLQEPNNDLWPHIHSFHIVDRNSHAYFIHNYKGNYAKNNRVTSNLEYLRNEFFYVAV